MIAKEIGPIGLSSFKHVIAFRIEAAGIDEVQAETYIPKCFFFLAEESNTRYEIAHLS